LKDYEFESDEKIIRITDKRNKKIQQFSENNFGGLNYQA